MAIDFLGNYRELLEQLTGRPAGDAPSTSRDFLDEAYGRYGAIKSPTEYASEIQKLNENIAPGQFRTGGRTVSEGIRGNMATSYNTYKDQAKQLQDLYTQRRDALTDEAQIQSERDAFNAAKQQAYQEHIANRAYLKTQNRMAAAGRLQAARDRMAQRQNEIYQRNLERGAKFGIDVSGYQPPSNEFFKNAIERGNKGYEAVKDLGRGLEVPTGDRLELSEVIGRMVSDAGSRIQSRKRGPRGYESR